MMLLRSPWFRSTKQQNKISKIKIGCISNKNKAYEWATTTISISIILLRVIKWTQMYFMCFFHVLDWMYTQCFRDQALSISIRLPHPLRRYLSLFLSLSLSHQFGTFARVFESLVVAHKTYLHTYVQLLRSDKVWTVYVCVLFSLYHFFIFFFLSTHTYPSAVHCARMVRVGTTFWNHNKWCDIITIQRTYTI